MRMIFFQIKKKIKPFFYAAFQFGRYNIFKKILNIFFANENMKHRPSKVTPHNWLQFFFHSTCRAAQTSLELIFHIINMSQDSSVYWFVFLTQTASNQYQIIRSFMFFLVDRKYISFIYRWLNKSQLVSKCHFGVIKFPPKNN